MNEPTVTGLHAKLYPMEVLNKPLDADLQGIMDMLRENDRLLRENDAMRRALLQFASCNLHDGNCASWEVANKRIRNLANTALALCDVAKAASE